MQAFFDPNTFPWTARFTDQYDLIRQEIAAACGQRLPPLYASYVETITGVKPAAPRWRSLSLVFFTIRNPAVLALLPTTAHLLAEVPGLVTANVLRLDGDTHLKPHGGYTPDVLRCHLGVIVPEPDACEIRVGQERRNWRERQWLVFDDYLEHEVWHRGALSRVVLLIDVVREGLDRTPRQVAERFFDKAPDTRFDEGLDQIATRTQWNEWLERGEFPVT